MTRVRGGGRYRVKVRGQIREAGKAKVRGMRWLRTVLVSIEEVERGPKTQTPRRECRISRLRLQETPSNSEWPPHKAEATPRNHSVSYLSGSLQIRTRYLT